MRAISCSALAFCMLLGTELCAEETASAEVAVVLTRTDSIPDEVHKATDPYFEGYIQALVDMHYAEYRVVVIVKNKSVWLANMPSNKMLSNSIASFVRDVPGVENVHVLNGVAPEDEELRDKYVKRPQISGIWFPQMTELFLPIIADPRAATYSLGWRSGDRVCGNKCIGVSLGDDFPVYRWLDVLGGGDLQIGIEAGIWSVFNMDPHPNLVAGSAAELINTDFYVGIPITYALGPWSCRLRCFHISGHLGDEYMIDHPNVVRLNPSIEAVDFFVSYQATEAIRLYVGPGVYVHSDPTFKWKPLYIEYGTEARFLGSKFLKQRLYGTCFIAILWRNLEQLDYNFDGTYRMGYEFSKLQGIGRKFRLYVGYHHGYSLEGQFAKERTHYFEYNMNYGF
ncbi:MAG: hypothetical protein COT85_03930 [Chlamydiae bacterium CG10_big_fil_rev_8_21_14_0_10_42_34]|nr:MAG: hypothetical protein COT85_03930 [Chlamydiae bacterium CG10_big_fil_rev_8_21_14_0_10_42_34]